MPFSVLTKVTLLCDGAYNCRETVQGTYNETKSDIKKQLGNYAVLHKDWLHVARHDKYYCPACAKTHAKQG